MAKITYTNKTQIGSYDGTKGNAQDWNEVKTSVNAAYDAIAAIPTATSTVLRVNLSQTGTANPVATVLENTTGYTFGYSRQAAGTYLIFTTSGVAPLAAKIFVLSNHSEYPGVSGPTSTLAECFNDGEIALFTKIISTGVLTDAILFNTCIEVRVYP